jgi:hypothetical protein
VVRDALGDEGTGAEITLRAVNRRGRTVDVTVAVTPLLGPGREVAGAVLVMD